MSTDYFSLLGLPRQAALDEEALTQAHHAAGRSLQAAAAPDAAASMQLNEARDVLSQPDSRLRHLLELESADGEAAWRTVPLPEELMGLFLQLGPLLQEVDAFAKKKQAASSALARALLAGEEMRLRERVEDLAPALEAAWQPLIAELTQIDALRAQAAPDALERMALLSARMAYLRRWSSQQREAFMKLAT
ncbi:MAG: hypothetical protein KDK99_02055 [Verrucomicrobiales bacterium]|nr:hypothetical protein [Verrucomicrobiales bacterium]